jgi:cation transport ATPase
MQNDVPPDSIPSPIANPKLQIASLLNRPLAERVREYKYRFAQSVVFGLPVIALHFFGPSLGGPEAGRWVGLLQLLLAGWVMYVGAMAMLVEGILRRRVTADAMVASGALGLYLVSAFSVVHVVVTARSSVLQGLFPWTVTLVTAWSAMQWRRHARKSSSGRSPSNFT